MADQGSWDQYGKYLNLEKLLDAQNPCSASIGGALIHDEILFIQFHQIYELWFKQILCELDEIQTRLSRDCISESEMQPILTYLGRIVEIFKQLESMIDVLQTMPSQAFVDFREYLGTASGFQSVQFRLIETRLGLQRKDRLCVFHGQFDDAFNTDNKSLIRSTEKHPNLFEQIDGWLSRTPFVNFGEYTFLNEYRAAIAKMFADKTTAARQSLTGEALDKELAALENGKKKFESIFDPEIYAAAQQEGRWRLSWRALQAALFITIYRHEPVLQAPYALLTKIMDVDELLARWRFRHALIVQRMVGHGVGTGGSSGYEYLMKTVQTHRIFTDLFALSAYLIPSRLLPPLPADISAGMDYRYTAKTT
ncbi:MAG: tryptophan 2,3-dioxygenase family protein [Alphaproteobacteria bacterium]